MSLTGLPATPASADTQPADSSTPATVSADPLPTVQINGVVRKQVIVGNTVYAGGEFTSARPAGSPAGSNETPRSNILAYNLSTGVLLTGFAPSVNGPVLDMSLSPDKTKLYISGSFSTINGLNRRRVAQFNLSNNGATATLTDWYPNANGTVNGVYATNSSVYLGGAFTVVRGVARTRLAAVSASGANPTLLPLSAEIPDYRVQDLVVSPDESKVVIVGNFTQVNGSSQFADGMAMLDVATSQVLSLPVGNLVYSSGGSAGFLDVETDGTSFYASAWNYAGHGNIEGAFKADWATGSLTWIEDCHGDTYAVYPVGDVVYEASHKHYCGNSGGFPQTDPWTFHHSTAVTQDVRGTNTADIYGYPDHPGEPRPEFLDWYPDWSIGSFTGANQAVWTVTGNDDYVLYGGEFPRVNNVAQSGLVRFARREIAPNKVPPTQNGSRGWNPSVVSIAGGTVRVAWPGNPDRDNATVTYRLYRGSLSNLVYEKTVSGYHFWELPQNSFIDTGLTPGSTQQYRVEAVDPYGNRAGSNWISVTVADGAPLSSYALKILNDSPVDYWRMGESGSTSIDYGGGYDLTNDSGVTGGASGAIVGDSDPASTFAGRSDGRSSTSTAVPGPNTFALEAWIKTTTNRGGKIIGFGSASSGNSSSYDRHLYMRNDGRLVFGVYPGAVRTVTSSAAYRDGQWHQVVAQLSSAGMELYVDGVRVAQRADVTGAQSYNGYWRVGGDNLNGWDSVPSSVNFAGTIDEVAVFGQALSRTTIRQQYLASGRTLSNLPPTASFTSSTRALDATFDASESADPDAGPLTYSWDFGDGSPAGSGMTPSHTYAAAGTRTVTLTVTDEEGAIATVSHTVTSTDPNPMPSDAYGAAIFAADPQFYWRLDETSGATAADSSFTGSDTGAIRNGVTLGQPGALLHQAGTAAAFNGSNGLIVDSSAMTNPGAFTNVLWFKTSTTSGGKLIGFGDASNGDSSNYDRHTYMLDTGQLRFGVWTGQENTITSPNSYNDGNWHMLVSSQSKSDGMRMYVDGQLVGTNGQTEAQSYTGYWRIGGDTTWGGSSSRYFNGNLDEVALFNTAVDAAQVAALYTKGTQNESPTARFTIAADDLGVTLDGSASSDPEGPVANYAWDFGDGGTQSGASSTASHTYAAPGTYTIKLTVADGDGVTDTQTHDVTVAANQPPTAEFTTTASKWTVAADASASSDDSGIASYAWDFGESTGSGDVRTGKTPSYTYGAAGTYAVTLTVTDDDGVSRSVSHDVQVLGNQPPVAAFTATADKLSASVDAGSSSDPEGGALTYQWDFGESVGGGDTRTGETASYTYAGTGTYTVTLTVTDDEGEARVATQQVEVTGNQSPTASIGSPMVTGLKASVDGSGSSDADGTVASYLWDFGATDGASDQATGKTASYTYAAAGTYTVTLTVTDDDGSTDTAETVVTVDDGVLALDSFARSATSGWGSADYGGAWTSIGLASRFSVSGDRGLQSLVGTNLEADLASVSARDVDVAVSVGLDKLPSSTLQTWVNTRKIGSTAYGARLRFNPDGTYGLHLTRDNNPLVGTNAFAGRTYTPGDRVWVRFQTESTSATTTALRVKVWQVGTTEPTAWTYTTTNSTAANQASGSVSLKSYTATTGANPIVVSFDDLSVSELP
ncbi:PKD domain-containing protein [Nocardioides terrae]|uniref:PKD domain-containing protein n=1 Tax=Nocardioides terrae TaxID=574651 RepID=UPI001C31C1AA|nr:PKD domain-containing protein [Nocardioides terrae]